MSQMSIKYLELTGLKNQIKNLENLALQREQERKTWEAKFQELQTKNDKLMKQVTDQFLVQGKKTYYLGCHHRGSRQIQTLP